MRSRPAPRDLAATTALDLGVIARVRGDHETTLRYFRMSLGEFRAVGAPKDVLATLNSSANC